MTTFIPDASPDLASGRPCSPCQSRACLPLLSALPWLLMFLTLLAFGAMPGWAQEAQTKTPRSILDAGRLELTQIEAALARGALDDRRLADLRERLTPIGQAATEIVTREAPKADEIQARLTQLGPAPDKAKGQSEGEDVARDRAEQQRLLKDVDALLRLARAQQLQVEQIGQAITERRRANFAREILAQHPSITSPWLWGDLARTLPADIRALRFLSTQWAEAIAGNLDWYEGVLLVLLLGAGFYLVPRARRWVITGSLRPLVVSVDKDARETAEAPNRMERVMRAFRTVVLSAFMPGAALFLFYRMIEAFELLPGRANTVMGQAMIALAFYLFLTGLGRAVLSPGNASQRLLAMPDARAEAAYALVRSVAMIVAISRGIEAVHEAIVASLPMTIATRGVIAIIVSLTVMRGLHRVFREEDRTEGDPDPAPPTVSVLPVRLGLWLTAVLILGATLAGFIPLAHFLVTQLVWVTALILIGVLMLALIDEVIGAGMSAEGMIGRKLKALTGLNASSLDQASVLGAGFARLFLLVLLGMVALAPWGIDSSNLVGNLRAAFFGFQVGGITISLSTLVLALVLFAVGLFVTRAIQSWLDQRYLPKTTLDPGLRNSIQTIFGYLGFIVAISLALSQLGVSFEKLTIVVGALSVGIGFGLQSIANNFVSGLILLWERPIRVGDWIVVGDEQGTVKRINVRSTEIVTFDRATLIIPNSEFIMGRVKNWVHSDRTARIIVPINVDYESDPEQVQDLLLAAANAHRDVLSEPKPQVIFKNLGESGLDFELRCFVDVDSTLRTRSDLLFDIFKRLKEAGIGIPYPTRRLEITNFPALRDGQGGTRSLEIPDPKA